MREQKHSSATPCPLAAEQSKTLSLPNRPSLSNHGSCCRGGRSSVGRRIDASHPPGPYERPPRRRPPPFRDALVRRHLLFPCLPPASLPLPPRSSTPAAARTPRSRAIAKSRAKILTESELRDPWLASLSLLPADDSASADAAPTGWAIGVDPDTRGAVAVLSPDGSSQVFDNPFVHIVVSDVIRKRLDTKSIIQLLRGLNATPGTTAYIEKSSPFPTDGKLGWWSTGFSYGLWIAALVASGFSVVPVASQTWKSYFGLLRSKSTKDDSRQAASILFPDMALSLKLKKHHGRAEALLLAAYGKGLTLPSGKFSKTTT